MLDKRITQVLVVSLPEDTERRKHISEHFEVNGIDKYQIVDGVCYKSDAVKQFYLSNRVSSYPCCFRCNKAQCECPNNIIIPQQVANWLAFKKAWVKATLHEGLTLVCEDDVYFYPGAMKCLSEGLNKVDCDTTEPILIRLAHSGLDSTISLSEITEVNITNRITMSNVAFIFNSAMAKLLLNHFTIISTTSDVFIHNWIASMTNVKAYTFEPLIATDLSFNKDHARFISRIHPKGLDEDDMKRMKTHTKRAKSKEDYEKILANWVDS
jgi:GR25 family glycosyltransferase involved in LPS biosynthesis